MTRKSSCCRCRLDTTNHSLWGQGQEQLPSLILIIMLIMIMIIDEKVDHNLIICACSQHRYDYPYNHCTMNNLLCALISLIVVFWSPWSIVIFGIMMTVAGWWWWWWCLNCWHVLIIFWRLQVGILSLSVVNTMRPKSRVQPFVISIIINPTIQHKYARSDKKHNDSETKISKSIEQI